MQKLNEIELKNFIGGGQPQFFRSTDEGGTVGQFPSDPQDADGVILNNGTVIYFGSGPAY